MASTQDLLNIHPVEDCHKVEDIYGNIYALSELGQVFYRFGSAGTWRPVDTHWVMESILDELNEGE